ncbi:hypothetical protein VP01_386g7 [Puccinia sorghi]|uniref:Uncharacterized protein n=1 Tax=Puccinia sorghi TaxID=27349 RepID=A0A0L6USZ3_9BASI|nr:hypothetical protein VP01_386g7 [Puccinia sorghi]
MKRSRERLARPTMRVIFLHRNIDAGEADGTTYFHVASSRINTRYDWGRSVRSAGSDRSHNPNDGLNFYFCGGADRRNARYEEAWPQELRSSDELDAERRPNQWEGPHSCDCGCLELKTSGSPGTSIYWMVALFFRESDDHQKWLQIKDNSFSVHFNVHTFFFLLCPFPLDWVDKRMSLLGVATGRSLQQDDDVIHLSTSTNFCVLWCTKIMMCHWFNSNIMVRVPIRPSGSDSGLSEIRPPVFAEPVRIFTDPIACASKCMLNTFLEPRQSNQKLNQSPQRLQPTAQNLVKNLSAMNLLSKPGHQLLPAPMPRGGYGSQQDSWSNCSMQAKALYQLVWINKNSSNIGALLMFLKAQQHSTNKNQKLSRDTLMATIACFFIHSHISLKLSMKNLLNSFNSATLRSISSSPG